MTLQLDPLYAALYLAAARAENGLTRRQRARLELLRRRRGKSLAELVRDALDAYPRIRL